MNDEYPPSPTAKPDDIIVPIGPGKTDATVISFFLCVYAHGAAGIAQTSYLELKSARTGTYYQPGRLPTCRESNPLLLFNIETPIWLLTHRKGFTAATIFRQLNELLSAQVVH